MSVRKYLSLIVDHDNPDHVGRIKLYESPKARLEKNSVSPIQKFDKKAKDFYAAGKEVGLGYHDFEDESEINETFNSVVNNKLLEIDEKWLEQAEIGEVAE